MRKLKSPIRIHALDSCFKVTDGAELALGYFYFADNPTGISNKMTKDEAREAARFFAEALIVATREAEPSGRPGGGSSPSGTGSARR